MYPQFHQRIEERINSYDLNLRIFIRRGINRTDVGNSEKGQSAPVVQPTVTDRPVEKSTVSQSSESAVTQYPSVETLKERLARMKSAIGHSSIAK